MNDLIYINSDDALFVDVDDTLVMWDTNDNHHLFTGSYNTIKIKDPYIKDAEMCMIPHDRNIDTLKRNYGMGKTIIVWSMGGAQWARAVVRALKLEDYVSVVMSKPKVYLDDKEIGDWGCSRCYLQMAPQDNYSKIKKGLEDSAAGRVRSRGSFNTPATMEKPILKRAIEKSIKKNKEVLKILAKR